MVINANQFAMTPTQGMQDLNFEGCVISGILDTTQATNVVAGQAMKLLGTSNGLPKLVATTADTDPVFGFALYSIKNGFYKPNTTLEIAMKNSVMYMTSGGAITAGAGVSIVSSAQTVIQQSGGAARVGFAIDAATASGQLIRVYIETPTAGASSIKEITVTATLAQINAGLTLIPGVAGQAITVTNFIERVLGGFASDTSVNLQSTNASPVIVEATAVAGLTNGAVLTPGSANVTLGAGFGAPLGTGDGLAVANIGSAATGGTSITYTISYAQF